MSTGKRNRAWPIAIVLSVAVVGVLAAFIALAVQPVPASANGPEICHGPFAGLDTECATHTAHGGGAGGDSTDPVTPVTVTVTVTGAGITSDSTSGGGAPEFQVVIDSLPENLAVGSSIVLFLEDDYQEPATIPASSVYFVALPETPETGSGARGVRHHCAED